MKTILKFAAIFSLSFFAGISLADEESSILRIKADPRAAMNTTVIISGIWSLDDYYNYGYERAQRTHASYWFSEADANGKGVGDVVHLYMNRDIGADVTKSMIEFYEKYKGESVNRIVRAKVRLLGHRYSRGKQWDGLEVVDVSFRLPDSNPPEWGLWLMEERREQAEKAAAAERERIDEEIRNHEQAEDREQVEARKQPEPERPREWRDVFGKLKMKATFLKASGGFVSLQKADGKTAKIEIKRLRKEDRDYIFTKTAEKEASK